jgi:nitrogen-specific signal transduction histidine kinase/CheY-like chemotaxis protein
MHPLPRDGTAASQPQSFQAQKQESLALLAGSLAHDFNNLLVGILTAADLLRRDLAPGSEEHGLAEIITKAAERAAGLTRQLLVCAGKSMPARRPLALNGAVEESLGQLSAAVPSNVALVTAFDPALPPTAADPAQLRDVITHLVLNAAEAIGAKAGRIRLATGVEVVNGAIQPPPELRPGRYVYLEVTDDGCGMPAEVQARIFDPFFSTKGKGRGLGLSAAQGIVRAHGGGLRATSTPGAGTSLRVLLPAADGRAAAPESAAAAPPPSGRAVLVIDDEPVVRGVVARALGHCGLEALSAAGGREGLELFRRGGGRIGVVLLDLGLSGHDGLQTLAALRALRPDVRVVLTGGSEPGLALSRAGLEPAAGFLAKPYTVHALLDVVGRALHPV